MVDITEFLTSIGCESFADAFEENGITADLLPELAENDLKELGLNIGDRIRFRKAVEKLFADGPRAAAKAEC